MMMYCGHWADHSNVCGGMWDPTWVGVAGPAIAESRSDGSVGLRWLQMKCPPPNQ